jgi:RNA polymerase sigma-70 factor (ECF subfamily)
LVFGLYAVDQLTHKEIAAYLGISEGTSKSQYAKAKMKLKEILTLEKETV